MNEVFSRGIEELKNKLIDTSRRNKLINYKKPSKARNLKIIDESAEFIFNHLIKDENTFRFSSIPEPDIDSNEIENLKKRRTEYQKSLDKNKVASGSDRLHISRKIDSIDTQIAELQRQALFTPEERAKELGFNISNELPDIDLNDDDIDEKHIDDDLQTLHYPNEMEKILTNIERNARSIIEETGSNMLYLVLGVLQWEEAKHSDHKNKSPLITIPVVLTKTKKNSRYSFSLEYSGEGLGTNRSLAEKILFEFGIVLPELTEEITFRGYLQEVQSIISHQKSWSIKQEISLDFLHFGKILMYQDLKEENWDEGNGLIDNSILKDIFIGKEVQSDSTFAPEYDIDTHKLANSLPLVMDADSSQHSAIVDVVNGNNVIIEGPPGTGKSQTISNIIAALLAEGKSVLFVSEKLAALEVVHKRLKSIGLSDFCLELHSHKSKKAQILQSIQKRMDTSYENIQILDQTIINIEYKKKQIKEYIDAIHNKFGAIEQSVYSILWTTEKYIKGSKYLKFDVLDAKDYTHLKLNNVLDELDKYRKFQENYNFDTFFWKGLDLYKLDFIDIDDFLNLIQQIKEKYQELQSLISEIPFDLGDEYDEVENIASFMDNIEIPSKYNSGILKQLTNNYNDFQTYLSGYEDIKVLIEKIKESVQEYTKFSAYNNSLILDLNVIEKIVKDLSTELNLPRNYEFDYILSLAKAIEQLAKIDEKQYLGLSKKFGTSDFEILLVLAKKDQLALSKLYTKIKDYTHLEELNSITTNQMEKIEKIVEEKKDSFFRFLSGEYRNTHKKLQSILIDPLPEEKNEWTSIIAEIKEYVDFKDKFENNEQYSLFFGCMFNGINTDWDGIKVLSDWSNSLRADARNIELITFILSASEVKYKQLLSKKDNLNEAIIQFTTNLDKIENIYEHRFIKKLYRNKSDINIDTFKEKLENIDDELEDMIATIYREFEISSEDSFSEDLLATLPTLDLEDVEHSIQKIDTNINDLLYIFSKFSKKSINLKQQLIDLNTKYSLSLNISEESYKKVLSTYSLFNIINDSKISPAIKNILIDDFKNKHLLDDICHKYQEIVATQTDLKIFGIIKKEFYGDLPLKISVCISKLDLASENKGSLSIWSDFRKLSHSVIDLGLEGIVSQVEKKELPLNMIRNVFKYNFYNTLVKDIFRSSPILVDFSRLSHEQIIQTYRELDQQLIIQNRKRVAYLASQRSIPQGYRGNLKSELTELSLIENEVSKKKRHIPIRQLVKRAPQALQGLKPCFMMSPLSVSQYLPPNDIKFDVLVVDEASQLRPEESLGSIARANQVVIVGDPKQLPPTSFFDSMEKSTEDETVASESESILDICLNLYKPIRQLRWHYRSQHESLINFSNQHFYDGNLLIFPSPTGVNSDELGVKHHYIQNSVYQDSRNKVEAKIIIEHLEIQMKNYPDRSIGIGTFNSSQRDLIQDMIDEKEKTSPILSMYIAKWRKTSEPFFIKNLENLQGDERDVIIISTTYGKDRDSGRVYQRFGPINTDTGWRRLNVMFTRAKQKMEIFTSLAASDIIIGENSSRGVRALRAFLNYMETSTLTKTAEITGKGFDSEFEESVFDILNDAGFKSVPQVGVAGYFIDLSIVSEQNPNDFILAIECDGATYHSSKSARDRDRLKQDVLEKLGWTVYRIWSVDWYKNREIEISKLIEAARKAQAQYKGRAVIESDQTITIDEVKEIDEDIDAEIKKELNAHHHEKKVLTTKEYTQLYLTDEKVTEILQELRDTKIASEFEINKRCILSDMMIEQFVKYKPIDMDEFRSSIPLRYRDENVIDIDQMKYMNDIFEILELADE